jgi:hypothetical protein
MEITKAQITFPRRNMNLPSVLLSLMLLALPLAGQAQPKGAPSRGKPIRAPIQEVAEPAPATNTVAAPKVPATRPTPGDYRTVGFDLLASYTFTVPEGVIPTNEVGKSEAQIPVDVKVLNEKKVAITGFMLPLKVDDGVVSELLIMKDQSMCCYGSTPRINDWVSVKMSGKGVKSVMDQPVTLFGKMHVGEMVENGYLIGIYKLDGEKMELQQGQ